LNSTFQTFAEPKQTFVTNTNICKQTQRHISVAAGATKERGAEIQICLETHMDQ